MTQQHPVDQAVKYWYDAAVERREERDRLRAVVVRLAQMADAWERELPEVIRTPAVVSAIRAALEPAAGAHDGDTQDDGPRPRRGDQFEAWLKTQRDEYEVTSSPQWRALDEVLDTYRLHADTGTPLSEHVCEGPGCDCLAAAAPVLPVGSAEPAHDEAEVRPECAHCWREIENRGAPNMGGPRHDHWVHIPGGFTVCFPQRGGDSPRAEPRTTGDAS